MEIKLVPLKEKHKHSITGEMVESVERILVYQKGYPMFMTDLDFIWDSNKVIYDKLMKGEEVVATLELS